HCNRGNLMVGRIALGVFMLLLVACGADSSAGAAKATSGRDATIRFVFAIYFLPKADADPILLLKDAVATVEGLDIAAEIPAQVLRPVVVGRVENAVADHFTPPDLRLVQYFGHGLSKEQ